jgi:hypothetical protein
MCKKYIFKIVQKNNLSQNPLLFNKKNTML